MWTNRSIETSSRYSSNKTRFGKTIGTMKAKCCFLTDVFPSLPNELPGFVLVRLAEEVMEALRPIFEALRQREELPCSYPLHVGSTHGTKQAFIYGHSRSQGSTTPGEHHYTHHHGYQPSPGYHWVMLNRLSKCGGWCTPVAHVSQVLFQFICLLYYHCVLVLDRVIIIIVKSISIACT